MAPPSQELEPPAIPGRFKGLLDLYMRAMEQAGPEKVAKAA
jgi:hypothetical protein